MGREGNESEWKRRGKLNNIHHREKEERKAKGRRGEIVRGTQGEWEGEKEGRRKIKNK